MFRRLISAALFILILPTSSSYVSNLSDLKKDLLFKGNPALRENNAIHFPLQNELQNKDNNQVIKDELKSQGNIQEIEDDIEFEDQDDNHDLKDDNEFEDQDKRNSIKHDYGLEDQDNRNAIKDYYELEDQDNRNDIKDFNELESQDDSNARKYDNELKSPEDIHTRKDDNELESQNDSHVMKENNEMEDQDESHVIRDDHVLDNQVDIHDIKDDNRVEVQANSDDMQDERFSLVDPEERTLFGREKNDNDTHIGSAEEAEWYTIIAKADKHKDESFDDINHAESTITSENNKSTRRTQFVISETKKEKGRLSNDNGDPNHLDVDLFKNGFSDSGCSFYDNSTFVCDSSDILEFPKSVPTDANTIIIHETSIVEIPDRALLDNEAEYLQIKGNRFLANINKFAFKGLKSLRYLHFSENYHVENWNINRNLFTMFEDLDNLLELVLSSSNLSQLGIEMIEEVLLPSLNVLDLSYNPLKNIPRFAFRGLRTSPIKYLNLANCQLTNVDSDALGDLKYLERLDLHFNPDLLKPSFEYPFTSQFDLIAPKLPRTLADLDVSSNSIVYLPLQSLKALNSSLTTLNLAGNFFPRLGFEDGETFPEMPRLKYLNLDDCGVVTVADSTFSNLESLEKLSLLHNPLTQLYPGLLLPSLRSLKLQMDSDVYFHFPENLFMERKMERLEELRIESTFLVNITKDHFSGLKNLEILSLAETTFVRLDNHSFSGLKNLRVLSLAYSKSGNPVSWRTLKGPNKLVFLDLTLASIKIFDFYKCSQIDKKIEVLNLTGILADVDVPVNLSFIRELHNLKVLEIGNNRIRSWNASLFSGMTDIEELRMSGNGIDISLTSAMIRDMFNSSELKLLDLSGNIFECNEMIFKFFRFAKSKPDLHIVGYNEGFGYMCTDDKTNEVISFFNYSTGGGDLDPGFNTEGEVVVSPSALEISISSLIAFVVSLTVTAAVYRNRWYIRYYYLCYKQQNSEVVRREPFLYDAFISYSKHDETWVRDKLVEFLERTQPSLKLCLHERDFKVGSTIVENIVTALDSSRKVVIVLTKSYLNSSWCLFETQLAQYRLMDSRNLILIKLDTPDRSIPRNLQHLLSRVTYLSLDRDAPLPPPYTLPSSYHSPATNWMKLKVTLMSQSSEEEKENVNT